MRISVPFGICRSRDIPYCKPHAELADEMIKKGELNIKADVTYDESSF